MYVNRGEGCNSHTTGASYLSGIGLTKNNILAKSSAAFIGSKLKRSVNWDFFLFANI